MSVKLVPFIRKKYLLTYAFKILEIINFLMMAINIFSYIIGPELKILYTSVYRD